MLIKIVHPFPLRASEITAERLYVDRRRFLKAMGLTVGASFGSFGPLSAAAPVVDELAPLSVVHKSDMAGGENVTPYEDITHYNNFYAESAQVKAR